MEGKYDERFDELTGLVQKVAGRVDEMQLEMRDMRKETLEMRTEIGSHANRFDRIEAVLEVASGRQLDVIPKVIEIQKDVNRISETVVEQSATMIQLMNRIDTLDRRFTELDERTVRLDERTVRLDERTVEMESELKAVRTTMDSLIDPILDGKAIWANIRHLEERITRLEEKLAN